MIVTCPGCSSKYRVRNESVPAEGARMRCPKCETLFLAKPPVDQSGAAEPEPSWQYLQIQPAPGSNPGAAPPQARPGPAPIPGLTGPQAPMQPLPMAMASMQQPPQPMPLPMQPPLGAQPAPMGMPPMQQPMGMPPMGMPPQQQARPLGMPQPAPMPMGMQPPLSQPPMGQPPMPMPMGQPPATGAPPGAPGQPRPGGPPTGAGPITALFQAFDPASLPAEAQRPAQPAPPPPPETLSPSGLELGTSPKMRQVPAGPPPTGAPSRPPSTASAPRVVTPEVPQLRPRASLKAEVGSWAAVGVGAVGAVCGLVFMMWTTEAADLDGALMPTFESSFGVTPPRSTIGAGEPPVEELRRGAEEATLRADYPAAIVLWSRVKARDPNDPRATAAIAKLRAELEDLTP